MYGVGADFAPLAGDPFSPIGPDIASRNDWWFRSVVWRPSSSFISADSLTESQQRSGEPQLEAPERVCDGTAGRCLRRRGDCLQVRDLSHESSEREENGRILTSYAASRGQATGPAPQTPTPSFPLVPRITVSRVRGLD